MFLDVLRRRNPAFIRAAQALHQQGAIPANSYVLDLDTVTENARLLRAEGDRLGMKVYAMTKQVSRNTGFSRAVMAGGIDRAVAVDMACAIACHNAGLPIGHLGHLVQVPRAEAAMAARDIAPLLDRLFRRQGRRGRLCRPCRRAAAGDPCARPDGRRHLLSRA